MSVFPERHLDVNLPALEAGAEVFAFYHANHHPQGCRYVHVLHSGELWPVVGLSSGWLRATLVEPFAPPPPAGGVRSRSSQYVHLRFAGPFLDPVAGPAEDLEMHVHAGLVRSAEGCPEELLPKRPVLSVLSVRWWDYGANRRWSDYSVTNDGLHRDLIDGPRGLYPTLAGEFEMYTAFIGCTEDLDKISADWAAAALHGVNTVAWYFLWPQQLLPLEIADGCVREQALFSLLQRVERAGIRSGWPHPATLYRQLCGKLWIPQMSLHTEYRVPPTTRVQYADVCSDAERAAKQAIAQVQRIRQQVWGRPPVPEDSFRGVAKLGFSWQGDDVLPFKGAANLARVLLKLFEQRHSEQLVCLVQEMVPGVACEHRILCFHDAAASGETGEVYVKERLWLGMKARGEHHNHRDACEVKDFAMASAHVNSADRATRDFFGGDAAARERAEAVADRLADRWLMWFAAECADPPPVTRLDFLVAPRGGEDGGPAVWSCEVGEMGASLCSVECDARNQAALNWAVRSDPTGRFPMPLPPIVRNNGWKS